jgi:hypothetical protein
LYTFYKIKSYVHINTKTVDTAELSGLAGISTLGIENATEINWEFLRGNRVIICMDKDGPKGNGSLPGQEKSWELYNVLCDVGINTFLVNQNRLMNRFSFLSRWVSSVARFSGNAPVYTWRKKMQVQTEYYLGLGKEIVDSFRQDRDKRRFFILFTMLLATVGMNVSNAAAIQEYGVKLDQHSGQLHELNSKFEIFVAYMSTQKERDAQQDKRLNELENDSKEFKEGIKETKERVKKLEEESGSNSDGEDKGGEKS